MFHFFTEVKRHDFHVQLVGKEAEPTAPRAPEENNSVGDTYLYLPWYNTGTKD